MRQIQREAYWADVDVLGGHLDAVVERPYTPGEFYGEPLPDGLPEEIVFAETVTAPPGSLRSGLLRVSRCRLPADALRNAGADVVTVERQGEHGGAFCAEEFPLTTEWAFGAGDRRDEGARRQERTGAPATWAP